MGWADFGLVAAAASAAALYAGAPHCHWRLSRQASRACGVAGLLLAAASLLLWVFAFGAAVGVPAMLAAWMLAMIVLPWLTLCTKGKLSGATGKH